MIPLKYRDDPGLEFLQYYSLEDLEPLVEMQILPNYGIRLRLQ